MEQTIRACTFKSYDGIPRYYLCRFKEYCCSQGCCSYSGSPFTFYQLWYFWLLLLLIILVCSGSGWWFRWRNSGGLFNTPTRMNRRRQLRQRVYPRCPHPLDSEPPSYNEVMRRQSEFPVSIAPNVGNPDGNSTPDVNWITSPPPPYEAINDLRNQQKKIEREIKMEERTQRTTNNNISRDENLNNNRPRFSARDRIRCLLGRTLSRSNNLERVQSAGALPPPYTISSQLSQQPQQPLAWPIEGPNVEVPQTPINREYFGRIQPPYRTSPSYPVMFPPPFLTNGMINNNNSNDVDDWSQADIRRTSSSTISRPHTAGGNSSISTALAHNPGELISSMDNTLNCVQPNIAGRPGSRSAGLVRSNLRLESQNVTSGNNSDDVADCSSIRETTSTMSIFSLDSRINSTPKNLNISTPVLPTVSAYSSTDDSVYYNNQTNNIPVSPTIASSVSRPVSSTTLLTPGTRTNDAQLPGIPREQLPNSPRDQFPKIHGSPRDHELPTISRDLSREGNDTS